MKPDFAARHWPLLSGREAPPPETADRHERRCLEFLAAYYEVNCRQESLSIARNSAAAATDAEACETALGQAWEAIELLLDRYAAIGFHGDAERIGDYYPNIRIHRPELPQILPPETSQSSHIAIPGLTDIPASELRGPVTFARWPHGKVDL